MSTTPFVSYLEAREALRAGHRSEAASHLTQALGGDTVPPTLQENIDVLLDYQSPAGEVALEILRAEVRKP